jgi:hypothetical protein
VELYVYSRPSEGPWGTQLARVSDARTFPIDGTGPWTVTVPVDVREDDLPPLCEVAVQPMHRPFPVVHAPQVLPKSTAPPRQLPISVDSEGDYLVPASCVLEGGIATATGSYKENYVPALFSRVGSVVELYLYTSVSPGRGTQLADLSREKPDGMQNDSGWTVSAPLDPRLGRAGSCQVSIQPTYR